MKSLNHLLSLKVYLFLSPVEIMAIELDLVFPIVLYKASSISIAWKIIESRYVIAERGSLSVNEQTLAYLFFSLSTLQIYITGRKTTLGGLILYFHLNEWLND